MPCSTLSTWWSCPRWFYAMLLNYHFGRSAIGNSKWLRQYDFTSIHRLILILEGPAETEGGGDGWEGRGSEEGREWRGERHRDHPVRWGEFGMPLSGVGNVIFNWFWMFWMQAFPWPAGKAPWLKENGGTGIVPDGALEKFGISSRCNSSLSLCVVL